MKIITHLTAGPTAYTTGFDYNFDALVDDPSKNELSNAFAITSNVEDRINFIGFLKFIFPSLSFLVGDSV